MRALVLGSAGQIGSELVSYLRGEDIEVVGFDILDDPKEDLRIPGVLDPILPKIDFVFFLAFDVGGAVYLSNYQDTYEFIANNMKIMANTFDSLRKNPVPFLFASSQMSDLSNSSYGILKKIGEKYTSSFKSKGKVVKFWNVYGVEKDPEKFHVITDFILMAKNENAIRIRTSGNEERQFLYSLDCSKCLYSIMDQFDKIREDELDISNFQWTSVFEVASIISKEFGDCPISRGNIKDDVQREKLPDPRRYILKYWNPETSVEDGIKNIIHKLEDNENN